MKKKTIAATCLAATMSLFASAHDVIDFCGVDIQESALHDRNDAGRRSLERPLGQR